MSRREELARMFERRGCSVLRAFDGRAGITAVRDHDLRAVVFVPSYEDQSLTRFIRYVRRIRPQAAVWLIGNPLLLDVAEFAYHEEMAVLPDGIKTSALESLIFGLERRQQPTAPPANGKPVLRPLRVRPVAQLQDFHEARAEFETRFIQRALRVHDGTVSTTAKAIGLARRNLQFKIQKLGIDIERSRSKSPEHEPGE